jgi:hypothetical protein
MTRFELLRLLLGQARENGFAFRKWYVTRLQLPWRGVRAAMETLASERRYYALLFSHDFARHFWKPGVPITFLVPPKTFQRTRADGRVETIARKGYVRRSSRPDAWRFHLKELAAAEEPLAYMRRYLRIEDELSEDR